MNSKKNFFIYLTKNFFAGFLIILGGAAAIYGVTAFETLTTTPGTAGNQSLGSQILSKLLAGGFDRTTDSLEAISEIVNSNSTKLDSIPTTSGGGYFTKCQVKNSITANYPTCPSGFTDIHNYASAKIYSNIVSNGYSGFNMINTDDASWYYTSYDQSTYACTVCEKN